LSFLGINVSAVRTAKTVRIVALSNFMEVFSEDGHKILKFNANLYRTNEQPIPQEFADEFALSDF